LARPVYNKQQEAQLMLRKLRDVIWGGKASATGWPPTAISYVEGVNVSARHMVIQHFQTENF